MIAQPACMTCRHYNREKPSTCDAFPDRIPDAIYSGGNPHTEPVAGDHGIRYEAGEPKGADLRK